MSKKDLSPVADDLADSPLSPSSSTEEDNSCSENMRSLMTSSYGDISGDESMFDRLLSDNECDHSLCDDDTDAAATGLNITEMVKKSASNLTEELDSMVRQAYMDHEPAEPHCSDSTSIQYKVMKNSQMELSGLGGQVTREGEMVSFVADDLAEKIRLSSPPARKSATPSTPSSRSSTPSLYKQALNAQVGLINTNIIDDVEKTAYKVAATVDNMLENLTGTLQSMSSLTVDCIDVHKNSVCNTCDVLDANIKLMYQLMAKCEELNKSMSPIYVLAHQTKEIRRVIELFEHIVDGK